MAPLTRFIGGLRGLLRKTRNDALVRERLMAVVAGFFGVGAALPAMVGL